MSKCPPINCLTSLYCFLAVFVIEICHAFWSFVSLINEKYTFFPKELLIRSSSFIKKSVCEACCLTCNVLYTCFLFFLQFDSVCVCLCLCTPVFISACISLLIPVLMSVSETPALVPRRILQQLARELHLAMLLQSQIRHLPSTPACAS